MIHTTQACTFFYSNMSSTIVKILGVAKNMHGTKPQVICTLGRQSFKLQKHKDFLLSLKVFPKIHCTKGSGKL